VTQTTLSALDKTLPMTRRFVRARENSVGDGESFVQTENVAGERTKFIRPEKVLSPQGASNSVETFSARRRNPSGLARRASRRVASADYRRRA